MDWPQEKVNILAAMAWTSYYELGTPITMIFPSLSGTSICELLGATTTPWIGMWRGTSNTGCNLKK